MFSLGFVKSVTSWLHDPADLDSSCIREDELDYIIKHLEEKPLHKDSSLSEEIFTTPNVELSKCQERQGYITSVTTNTAIIDKEFQYPLDETDNGLKVGDKVSYIAYCLRPNEQWRVKNVEVIVEESWETEAEVGGDEDPDVSVVSNGDIGVGEVLKETGAMEKNFVGQVERREGRMVYITGNVKCDLNMTNASFTPLVGDWVALDAFVQIREDSADLSGEILDIACIRPLRTRKEEGIVTDYNLNSRSGFIGRRIYFHKDFCVPGFIPNKGDKVIVEAMESSLGGLNWRALHVQPITEFGKPILNEEVEIEGKVHDKDFFKDKRGIFLTGKLDFGFVEMEERKVLELVIENGGTEPCRLLDVRFHSSRSKQMNFVLPLPALPRNLKEGMSVRFHISCTGKYPGFHNEIVVAELEGFKIARRVFCEVRSAALEAAIMAAIPTGSRRYDHESNRERAFSSQRKMLENQKVLIHGIPLSKAPAFVVHRLPGYHIQDKFWSILATPKFELEARILEDAPFFQQDLSPSTYNMRFHYLLYFAEAESTLDLRRYDMHQVKFERRGEYLALFVPGLAESRPSLLPGDKVEASSPFLAGTAPFYGVIHRVLHSEVWLLFDPAFHSKYCGEDYAVKFIQGRGVWKKFHHGLNQVQKNLGSAWLFPSAVTSKPPQVEFDEIAPGKSADKDVEVTLVPLAELKDVQASDKDEVLQINSSDDAITYSQLPEKPDSGRPLTKLLGLIEKEKSRKARASADAPGSESPECSGTESGSTPDRLSTPAKSVILSDSETSDLERSMKSDSRSKSNRFSESPRERMRRALALYSNRNSVENSPVNGSPAVVKESQSAVNGSQQAVNGSQPAVNGSKPAVNGSQPAVNGSKPAVNGSQPAVNGSKPAVENQPAVPGSKQRSCLLRWVNKNLNSRQKDAVRNVLRGEARPMPYIIFGPPGTGKTMTLVEAILQIYLTIPDSRILIATPSNSSANLIAERLVDSNILRGGDMVRIVAYHLVESCSLPTKLLPYCALIDINAQAPVDPERFGNIPSMSCKAIGRHRITVGTCVSLGTMYSLDLPSDHFTHVVMDEAGQAMEPETMIPLGFLNRVKGQCILAGDPHQLGPVVPSKTAEKLGLGKSFLDRILSRFPYNRDRDGFPETGGYDPRLVTKLIFNYRSLPSILQICSDMFYDSELIPTVDGETSHEASIHRVLTQALDIPQFGVIFEGVRGENYQETDCPSWFNIHEVVSVCKYMGRLSSLNIEPEDVGIITPYRKQVQKLRQNLDQIGLPVPKIATVEEFQGQERQIIILSTVRSSRQIIKADQKHHLGFVSSPRRLNVAISRAKSLLIVVGNPHLLCYDTYWRHLIKYCYQNGSYIGCDPPDVVKV